MKVGVKTTGVLEKLMCMKNHIICSGRISDLNSRIGTGVMCYHLIWYYICLLLPVYLRKSLVETPATPYRPTNLEAMASDLFHSWPPLPCSYCSPAPRRQCSFRCHAHRPSPWPLLRRERVEWLAVAIDSFYLLNLRSSRKTVPPPHVTCLGANHSCDIYLHLFYGVVSKGSQETLSDDISPRAQTIAMKNSV